MRIKVFVVVSLLLSALTAGAQEDDGSQMELLNFKSASEGFSVDIFPQVYERQHGEWPYDNNGNEPCACIIVKFEQMPVGEIKNVLYRFMGSDIKGEPELHLEEAEPYAIVFVDPSKNITMWTTHPKYGTSGRVSGHSVGAKQVYEVTLKNARTVTVIVTTEPSGLQVTLSDLDVSDTSPASFSDVPLGKHSLSISREGSVILAEEIAVSDDNVYFPYDLREKKIVLFVSDPSGALLSVDGKAVGETPISVELPYGWYNVKAVAGSGASVQKYIAVNDMTTTEFDLGIIKAEETVPEPKHRTPEGTPGSGSRFLDKVTFLGFGIAYVSKGLVTKGEGETIKEGGAWGPDDGSTSLGGIQAGLRVQPVFGAGVGLNTGVYYEFYSSSCEDYDYNKFTEHGIYIPVHVLYSLPLGGKTAARFHGGLGISYALQGKYSGSYGDFSSFYGNDLYPKKMNMTLELGVGLRLGFIQLNAQYGMGITDHKTYASYGDYKTKQNKLSFGISFLFGDMR